MNFFEHQDKARANTKKLVMLFTLAVVLIILALYAVFRACFFQMMCEGNIADCNWGLWDTKSFLYISLGTIAFIGFASLYRLRQLSKGGSSVAYLLGGRLVERGTKDPNEQRLLNVVEEMSIASGMQVPQVFLLESEDGINAFAAGFTLDDAVVAVSKGAMKDLTRDELQGVIAHEFSHILNGDMRLNIRLMGILFGIQAIGHIGRMFLQGSSRSSRSYRSSRKGGGGGMILIAAIAVMAIGYIGTFIGRIIQSAVSRQKEFLADASSVQFTRNPDGIAGALKKIGGSVQGSMLKTPAADQASHFFFSQGVKMYFFQKYLATHPDLTERIKRIDPHFDGDFPEMKIDPSAYTPSSTREVSEGVSGFAPKRSSYKSSASPVATDIGTGTGQIPEQITDSIGQITSGQIAAGAALLGSIPASIHETIAKPSSAARTIYALLLDTDDEMQAKQLAELDKVTGPGETEFIVRMFHEIKELDRRLYLPIADIAMPALRELPLDSLSKFFSNVEMLVTSDSQVSLFEFCLHYLLTHRLQGGKVKKGRIVYTSFKSLRDNVLDLITAIACNGNLDDPEKARQAFYRGTAVIPDIASTSPEFEFTPDTAYGKITTALERLSLSAYNLRRQVIDACAHCAIADKVITVEEGELLRMVSSALDSPLPPFMEGGAE